MTKEPGYKKIAPSGKDSGQSALIIHLGQSSVFQVFMAC